MLLCQACSSDGDSDSNQSDGTSQLEIHVYTPGRPVVTRADEDYVDPDDPGEMAVNSLDIWVFVSQNATVTNLHRGDLVGHLTPRVQTTESSFTGTYQMTVSEEFANERPDVDVYVMANATDNNTGLSLSHEAEPNDLDNAKIGQNYFGVANPVMTTPADGLPMSGVLKDMPIGGTDALMTVGNPLTPVKVVRAVSKVRFLFSRTETQPIYIKRITLDGDVIPTQEYLFLTAPYELRSFRIDNSAFESEHALITLSGAEASAIPTCANPSKYAYTGAQSGQAYETLIQGGIDTGEIGQVGRFYLKETSTSKKLSGKIYYTVGENDETEANWKYANFSMSGAGDFTRNHTWIVYGYFAGKELIRVSSVDVTDWDEISGNQEVYNW
jgi:hypothetical protein